jgi:hypothetical protein
VSHGTLVGIMGELIDGKVPPDPERWAHYVEAQLRSVGYHVGPDPTWAACSQHHTYQSACSACRAIGQRLLATVADRDR